MKNFYLPSFNIKSISYLFLFVFVSSLNAQQSITVQGTAVTQNFNGIGTTPTAALPAGFAMGTTTNSTDWSLLQTTTSQAAGTTGTGILTSGSAGGAYNFANGITGSSTERAIGFLNSSGYTSSRSIVYAFTNNTGITVTSMTIQWDYEKYRSGSRQWDWTFFHGNTSSPVNASTSGDQSYPADAGNTVVSNPPTSVTKTITLTGLNIPNGSTYYIRWTLTGLSGSSNGQALGIDNFSITLQDVCSGTPNNGTASISSSSGCAGATINLSTSGISTGSGISYQWQSSTDNVTFTNISGATSSSLQTIPLTSLFYRLNTTCSNSGQTSSSTVVSYTVNNCTQMPASGNISVSTCSGTFYDPGVTGNYPNSAISQITIFPSTAGQSVRLVFSSFNTESGDDGLVIYNGNSTAAPIFASPLAVGNFPANCPAGSWYGTTSPGTVTSTAADGSLTLVFRSDAAVNPAGFEAAISCVTPPVCTGRPTALAATNVTLSSATLNWSAATPVPANGYHYFFSTSPNPPTVATIQSGSTNNSTFSATVTGLSSDLTYYYWVRSNCAGGTSDWYGPVSFYTGYCVPSSTSVDGTGITNVSFGLSPNTVNNSTAAEANNYGNYSSLVGNLQQGQVASVLITFNTLTFDYNTSIWIDWNNDLDFNDPGEQVYTGLSGIISPNTLNATFTVPAGATLGNYRMRIGAGDNSIPAVCGTSLSAVCFEDYTVNIVPVPSCAGTPNTGTATISLTSGCPGVSFNLNSTGLSTGTGISYQWQSSPDGVTWTGISGATATSFSTSTTSTLQYRITTTCSISSQSSNSNFVTFTVNSSGACGCGNYPAIFATSVDDEDISDVTVGTMSNSSNCSVVAGGTGSVLNRYGNYVGIVTGTSEQIGNTVNFSLTMSTCGSDWDNFFQIYVDWNQDGDFLDAGEQVFSQTASANGGQTVTGSFQVPMSATLGTTRMRIINIEDNASTFNYAHNFYTYGETEDYCFTVTPLAPCTGTPSNGTASITVSSGCAGVSNSLSASGLTVGTGITYQWQSSPNGTTWSNITGATASSFNITPTATTSFRLVTTCSNSSATATTNSVTYTVSLSGNCACSTYPSFYAASADFGEITSVTVGTMTNSSNCATVAPGAGSVLNQYSNFTTTGGATGIPNQSISFSLEQIGCIDPALDNIFQIYVDWNQDGDFLDAGERVFNQATPVIGSNTVSGTFTVPATATAGSTRMRIVNVETTDNTINYAHNNYTWGETEDYCFEVVVPQFAASFSSFNGGSTSWCPGETRTVTLSITNTGTESWTDAPGVDYGIGIKWNSETNYTNIIDAQNLAAGATATFSFTVTAPSTAGNENLSVDVQRAGCFFFSTNATACGLTAGPGNVAFTSSSLYINSIPSVTAGTDLTVCSDVPVTLTGTTNNVSQTYTNSQSGTVLDNSFITRTISVAGTSLNANQINRVRVNIDHTYVSDLLLTLIAPNGSSIDLSSNNGGLGQNYTNTVFTASAGTSITSGFAPFTGNFLPEVAFSGLSGTANGTWTLRIEDDALGDIGQFQNWSLEIDQTPTTLWTSTNGTLATPTALSTGITSIGASVNTLTATVNGCNVSDAMNLTVNQVPTVTANASATNVCAGTNITMTGGGATSYSWSGGVTNGQAFAASTSLTSFSVTGTDANGCTGTASRNITVTALPSPTITGLNTICSGQSTTFTASGGTTYLWSTGSTSSSITVTVANTYTVTATNSGTCSASTSRTLNITTDQCACLNYTVPTVASNTQQDITEVTVGSMTNTSVCGEVSGIGSIPNRYTNYTTTVNGPTVCRNQIINFQLKSIGCGSTASSNIFQIYIDWNRDGDFLDAGERVYNQPFSPTQTGNSIKTGSFTVPLTASVGVTRMRIVSVEVLPYNSTNHNINYAQTNFSRGEIEDYCITVLQQPQFTASYSNLDYGSINWCPGETRVVTVDVTNRGTVAWTDGAGVDFNIGIKWDSEPTYTVKADAQNLASGSTGTYSFTVTAPSTAGFQHLNLDVTREGCFWFGDNSIACGLSAGPNNSALQSPLLNIFAVPAINPGLGATICPDDSVQLNGNVGQVNQNFINSEIVPLSDNSDIFQEINVSGLSLNASDLSSVTVNIEHGFVSDLYIELFAPDGSSVVLWSNHGRFDPFSPSGENMTNTTFSMSGTVYTSDLTVADAPYTGTYLPPILFNGVGFDTSKFSSLTGPANGSWTLRVTDQQSGDVGIYNNFRLQFNDTPDPLWTGPGGFTSTILNPFVTPENTSYYVLSSTITGCTGQDSVLITVRQAPNPSLSDSTAVCPGANATLTASNGTSYLWSTGQTTSTIVVSAISDYTVSIVDVNGCNGTDTISVVSNIASTAPTFTSLPGVICPNSSALLVAGGGTAGTNSDIIWYTGPNGTGTQLGVGDSVVVPFTTSDTVYIRREGLCNNTNDVSTIVIARSIMPISTNVATTPNYCVDAFGWAHWYDNTDRIIFSATGDFNSSQTGYPIATINRNNTFYQQSVLPTSNCNVNFTPGEHRFEMQRNWNLDMGPGATPTGTYSVRFYYLPTERSSIISAAIDTINTLTSCGYTYKYNAGSSGWIWYKTNDPTYIPQSWEGTQYPTTDGLTSNSVTYVEMSNIPSFSGGSGGVILIPSTTLPINWKSFTGETDNIINYLKWVTATEENSSHFEILRSKDGISFESIGIVNASGNSSSEVSYNFNDLNPQKGVNYYRIDMIDLDGKRESSNIIALEIFTKENPYLIYPNPVNDALNYVFESDIESNYTVEISDALGRVVLHQKLQSFKGNNRVILDMSKLVPAAYYLKAIHDNNSVIRTEKIIKK
jgi:subtilisin-like proprotein convertase family protein